MQQAQDQIDPFAVPMVFLRVGWMDRYQGLDAGDEIKGGGGFVERHGWGFEICNFKAEHGRVYGHVTPRGMGDDVTEADIGIHRLGASPRDRSVSGVLAVWVSRSPISSEYVIVGWYRNATIYRSPQRPPAEAGRDYKGRVLSYYVTAAAEDSTLLAKDERIFSLPAGRGGIGQSSIWYADKPEVHREIRRAVLDYIERRVLPGSPKAGDHGTPRQPDPFLRQQIERAAVAETTRYFTSLGYSVDSVEKDNVGWDLEAVRGRIRLRLEVKGLGGPDCCVELSRPTNTGRCRNTVTPTGSASSRTL